MKLFKLSAPGWEKDFDSEAELKAELYSHLCQTCKDGEKLYDESGELVWEEFPVGPHDSIGDMLSSPCGCEYDVEM